jgi:hypothetical protein
MARIKTSSFLERGKRKRPPSSPGYETSGKENFNSKVSFRVDYSDYALKADEIDRMLSKQGRFIKDFYKFIGTPAKGTGKKTFFMELTPKAEDFLSKGNVPNSSIKAVPDGYKMGIAIQETLSTLGRDGKSIMQKYVNRIETGLMKREIRYEVRKRKDYSTLEVGWIRAWYKYFGFQEDGFFNIYNKKKVPGMRSIMRTSLELSPKFQRQVTAAIRKYIGGK